MYNWSRSYINLIRQSPPWAQNDCFFFFWTVGSTTEHHRGIAFWQYKIHIHKYIKLAYLLIFSGINWLHTEFSSHLWTLSLIYITKFIWNCILEENNFSLPLKLYIEQKRMYICMFVVLVNTIGPMHEENILGNTPVSARFQRYLKCWKILIFTRGIPTFKNETKTRQWVLLGVFPKKNLHA